MLDLRSLIPFYYTESNVNSDNVERNYNYLATFSWVAIATAVTLTTLFTTLYDQEEDQKWKNVADSVRDVITIFTFACCTVGTAAMLALMRSCCVNPHNSLQEHHQQENEKNIDIVGTTLLEITGQPNHAIAETCIRKLCEPVSLLIWCSALGLAGFITGVVVDPSFFHQIANSEVARWGITGVSTVVTSTIMGGVATLFQYTWCSPDPEEQYTFANS